MISLRIARFLLTFAGFVGTTSQYTHAAVFTIGPDGQYDSFANAVASALAAGPGRHELQLQAGDHDVKTTIHIPLSAASELAVSGGWDALFEQRTSGRAASSLHGDGSQRLLTVSGVAGRLHLEGITLQNGFDLWSGGLLEAHLGGAAALSLRTVQFRSGQAAAKGGCAHLLGEQQAVFLLDDVGFEDCLSDDRDLGQVLPLVQAAALFVQLEDEAVTRIRRMEAVENRRVFSQPGSSRGGAALFLAGGDSRVEASEIRIADNFTHAVPVFVDGEALVPGLFAKASSDSGHGSPTLRFSRLELAGNRSNRVEYGAPQVLISAGHGGDIQFSQALIHDGHGGIVAEIASALDTASVQFSHLTVTGHSIGGASFNNPSPTSLFRFTNSVIAEAEIDLITLGQIDQIGNFIGQDPGFVDAANGNFRLLDTGAAVDSGVREYGLGEQDLDGLPRDYGSNVDSGAFEARPWPQEILHRSRFE